jgi:subtilisin-like proprotein convertase family protein
MLPIRLSELPEAPLDISQSGIFPVSDIPNDITYKLSLQQIPSLSANQNIQVKTNSYTITKNDYNSILYFNNEISTVANLTIPNNTNKRIQPGYSIKIVRFNFGHVQIDADNGVTVYSPDGVYLRSKYSVAVLTKIDTNTWIINGHLSKTPQPAGGASVLSDQSNIIIPDSGIASSYPITFNVSNIMIPITKISLVINNYYHTYAGDVGMMLVSPNDSFNTIITGQQGSGSDPNITEVTITNEATILWDGYSNGVFINDPMPIDFDSPAPTASDQNIAIFIGMSPAQANGIWSLYVQDFAGGDSGSIGRCTLNIGF